MSKSAPRPGASKARLVITAITLENRAVAEVVADYGVSKSWVYELLARYRTEGDDGACQGFCVSGSAWVVS
jgi:transposase